jgi:hypothetical protein
VRSGLKLHPRVHRHHVESLLPRLGSWRFTNLIDQLNSFFQPNGHSDNAPQVFYFCPVLPSSAGGRRKRVWDQGQPFRVAVQFAPAADRPLPGHEEIDGPLDSWVQFFLDEIARS